MICLINVKRLTLQMRCPAALQRPTAPRPQLSSCSQSGRWTCWQQVNRRRSCPWPEHQPRLGRRRSTSSETLFYFSWSLDRKIITQTIHRFRCWKLKGWKLRWTACCWGATTILKSEIKNQDLTPPSRETSSELNQSKYFQQIVALLSPCFSFWEDTNAYDR